MSEGAGSWQAKIIPKNNLHGIKAERRAVTGFVRSADYL